MLTRSASRLNSLKQVFRLKPRRFSQKSFNSFVEKFKIKEVAEDDSKLVAIKEHITKNNIQLVLSDRLELSDLEKNGEIVVSRCESCLNTQAVLAFLSTIGGIFGGAFCNNGYVMTAGGLCFIYWMSVVGTIENNDKFKAKYQTQLINFSKSLDKYQKIGLHKS